MVGQRLDRAELLDHPVREAVYRAVSATPGTTLADVSEDLEASRSTLRYHVRVLEEKGMVGSRSIGRARILYRPEDQAIAHRCHLAQHPVRGRLLDLADEGPIPLSELADAVDVSPPTAVHHLDRLKEAGLVERHPDGWTAASAQQADELGPALTVGRRGRCVPAR